MRTFEEVINQLKQLDEITLLELLDISSEDLTERFQDIIEVKYDRLTNDLQQYFDETPEDEEDQAT